MLPPAYRCIPQRAVAQKQVIVSERRGLIQDLIVHNPYITPRDSACNGKLGGATSRSGLLRQITH